jgi:dihydroneopterin aldolase
LEDTVSYSEIARLVVQIGSQSRYRLMESLAEHIAQTILETRPTVERVTVRLSKRLPPAGLLIERAGVEITRGRSEAVPGMEGA